MEVLVGRNGFLASAIDRTDHEDLVVLGSKELDLLASNVPKIPAIKNADILFDAADYYPGVNATAEHPVEVYEKNVRMYENLFAFAALNGIKKIVTIGTTGCYPVSDELLSESMFNGDPAKLNQKLVSYALSRFTLLDIAALYRAKADIAHTHLVLPNFYGPGDKYEVGRSHLLASWIRDFQAAKTAGQTAIELWGPPTQRREFIYIDDAARYALALGRTAITQEVLNVGTATTPTYEDMAKTVLRALDFECTINWDLEKSFPRQQEVMDLTAMQKYASHLPVATPFDKGVNITVKEFLNGSK
ncbi:MAG: NAD-dependent epimerase/dehydratase family protein [Candidatus Saccharimonadales bacterium]